MVCLMCADETRALHSNYNRVVYIIQFVSVMVAPFLAVKYEEEKKSSRGEHFSARHWGQDHRVATRYMQQYCCTSSTVVVLKVPTTKIVDLHAS